MNKNEEITRLKKIINTARIIGPNGFMDAIIKMVDEEKQCSGCGKTLGPKDVCSSCLEKSWREDNAQV